MRATPSPSPARSGEVARPSLRDLTVVVPARNAEAILGDCLASVAEANPAEIIVVDGNSTDSTLAVARLYGARTLSDEGRGLPVARALGAKAARTQWVALVDADVILPPGSLVQLLAEFLDGRYTALQAGLHSVAGPGYWGQALAHHHRSGRSRNWFGVVATIFERDELLRHGFDDRFVSGEDIELRWRLERAGKRIGVSRSTIVIHRFPDSGFRFARDQFLADGEGLGRMVRMKGSRAALLLALPAAAGARGVTLSLLSHQIRWVPYYCCFVAFNYVGMGRQLLRRGTAAVP
jgi:glycosyltransferase involved in cell wall biosynthesis